MSWVVAFEHFYFVGYARAYGTRVPKFSVDPDRAEHYPEKQEAVRCREVLEARSPSRGYRVEEHAAPFQRPRQETK